jgi:hypothetical protein
MPDTRLVYDAQTTPRDVLTYVTLLADGELVSPDVTERVLALMDDQEVNYLMPAGLPSDEPWRLAHKTANVEAMLGDAGIVYTANGRFGLVILNEGLTNYEISIATFRSIARSVYRSVIPIATPGELLASD